MENDNDISDFFHEWPRGVYFQNVGEGVRIEGATMM